MEISGVSYWNEPSRFCFLVLYKKKPLMSFPTRKDADAFLERWSLKDCELFEVQVLAYNPASDSEIKTMVPILKEILND